MSSVRPYGKDICISCKGDKLLCNYRSCPLLNRAVLPAEIPEPVGTELSGPASSIFIDWQGYPEVSLGPLLSLNSDSAEYSVTPSQWSDISFEELIKLRSNLIRALTILDLNTNNKFIEYLQQLALSTKPVDVELRFRSEPERSLSFSSVCEPLGPSGELEFFKIVGNPAIPKEVEREIDSDQKTTDSILNLYQKGFDIYYLQRLLASGVFSSGSEKRLVPSSWSTRAVDKHLGNKIIDDISTLPFLNETLVYSYSYLFNHYEVLFVPGEWKYELFESWFPNTLFTLAYGKPAICSDFEGYTMGTDDIYRGNGCYPASRFAVAEGLKKLGKQATAIVFREVGSDYRLPLGVWHVREALRTAFRTEPQKFNSIKEALDYIASKLQIPLSEYMHHGVILRQEWINT